MQPKLPGEILTTTAADTIDTQSNVLSKYCRKENPLSRRGKTLSSLNVLLLLLTVSS